MTPLMRGKRTSHVISARLSERDHDELRALEVFQKWSERGKEYTARYIVTAALLALDGQRIPSPSPRDARGGGEVDLEPINKELRAVRSEMGDVSNMMQQIMTIVDQIADAGRRGNRRDVERLHNEARGMSAGFVGNLRNAVDFDEDDE